MSGADTFPRGSGATSFGVMRPPHAEPVHRRMNALLLLDDGWARNGWPRFCSFDAGQSANIAVCICVGRRRGRVAELRGCRAIARCRTAGRAGRGTGRPPLYDGESGVRVRGAKLRRDLHRARHGQGAEAAWLRHKMPKKVPRRRTKTRSASRGGCLGR